MINDEYLFSDMELNNLNSGVTLLTNDLDRIPQLREELSANPYQVMRFRYNIAILGYMDIRDRQQIDLFNRSIRKIVIDLGRALRCMACKLTVITMIGALLAKLGIAWFASWAFLSTLLDNLKRTLKGINDKLRSHIEKLISKGEKFEPWEIAYEICRFIGACLPPDTNLSAGAEEVVPTPGEPVGV